MSTYNILRCVPLNERVATAKSLQVAYPETTDTVDIIVKEVSAYDSTRITKHIVACATKLFDTASVSDKLRMRCVFGHELNQVVMDVVEIPKVLEVPSIHGGRPEYVSSNVHVSKTYILSEYCHVTFGLKVRENKMTITAACVCQYTMKTMYKGESNTCMYPPPAKNMKVVVENSQTFKRVFDDGFVSYNGGYLVDFCDTFIHIQFTKSDVDQFLASYMLI